MAFSLTPTSMEPFDLRYTVYLVEIKKRSVYIVLSFIVAFICAYKERVALMYSMTLSLQPLLSNQIESVASTLENTCSSIAPVNVVSSFPQSLVWEASTLQSWEKAAAFSNGNGAVRLIFTDVEEAFYALLSVSLLWCFFVWFPVLVYHVLCFFQPGFYIYQSKETCFFLCRVFFLIYGVLGVVDYIFIPRLLSFFYSFEIERSSLSIHAETKVFSYVSLYVFVYSITVILLVIVITWGSYKRQQRRHWFDKTFDVGDASTQRLMHGGASLPIKRPVSSKIPSVDFELNKFRANHLPNLEKLRDQYHHLRGKIWWGCLLISAFISPPEISSQLVCTVFLIVWSEVSMWLGYVSFYRFCHQRFAVFTPEKR